MRAHALLLVLLDRPGTFYQVCERAGYGIDGKGEEALLRHIFDGLLRAGTARLDGIIYSITLPARIALQIAAAPPTVGLPAAPAYRGTPYAMPVRVVRRSEGARA
jgi:hypothetical protein